MRELWLRMDAREFAQWKAYYQLEPFGAERDNLHAGIIASAISGGKPADFLVGPSAEEQDEEAMLAIAKRMAYGNRKPD